MDDTPLCPEWWPRGLWSMHFAKIPFKRPGGNPVNMPADVDVLLAALQAHTASYLMTDKKLAGQVRTAALNQMKEVVGKLEG